MEIQGKYLRVLVENCPQNHRCVAVAVCPVEALSQRGFDAPVVNHKVCIACGKCTVHCPKGVLELSR